MATPSDQIVRGKDVMSTNIISIDGMATAREAAAKMREENVHSLLVKKRHADDAGGRNRRLVGMVTLSALVLDYDLFLR